MKYLVDSAKLLIYHLAVINQISIIIPTLNEEDYLPNLLTCLSQQEFAGEMEVIVVDGNSKDATIAKAKEFDKKFQRIKIITTKPGIALQRNVGAREALYDTLLFIDADITLKKRTIKKLAKILPAKKRYIGTAFLLPSDGSFFEKIFFLLICYLGTSLYSFFDPIAYGGFLVTNKKNHRAINGFTEGSLIGEDTDYTTRSIKNGAEFKFYWNIPAFHSCRRAKIMGIFGLLWFYTRSFIYYKRYGLIYDTVQFEYPYGMYSRNKN